jgi:choline dehydrogenase-like flavoprotein
LVKYEAEQAPNPRSRVNLHHSKRDQLGLPATQLDWQLSDFDKFSIRRTAELIGIELGRAGLGRVRTDIDEDLSKFPLVETAWHHMGTTRMSENDRTGVVDSACRVHGLSNLYVAGSSVFPTGGRANPTLTIVALAIRLADHLKSVAR